MTLQEMVQTAKDDFGKDNAEWVARYKRYLNRAQKAIFNYREWPFALDMDNSFTAGTGVEEYTTTELNLKKMIALRVTDTGYATRVYPTSYDDFRDSHPETNTAIDRGVPRVYYATGRTAAGKLKIKLFPAPDRAYVLEYDYYKMPADLVTDTVEPEMPEPYQELMLDYTMWKSYQQERDFPTSRVYEKSFTEGLRQMAGDYMLTESSEVAYLTYPGEETE